MFKFRFKLDKNLMLVSIAIIGIIVTGVLILSSGNPGQFSFKIGSGLSNEVIAEKALGYINKNLLSGQTAAMVGVSEESGLVKIKIKISDREFDSYASKDGKLLFPQVINMEKDISQPEQRQNNQPTAESIKQTCDSLKKTDSPELEAYIVSKCPFGLQMQRVLADVVKNAPSLAKNIKVMYIGAISNGKITAMHGEAEAQENLRQICVRDEQNSKYWDYIGCHIKAGDVDNCLVSAAIDKNKLNSCMSDKNKGLAYAKKDFDLNAKYNIGGSPTLMLDGVQVSESLFGGRTSEALKSIICCASSNKADICSATLNTLEAAASFSETYVGSNSGSGNSGATGANCAPAQ
ncbi:MAG: Uncharacterized protein CEN87_455 [Parcubacteria group bacterium Licking1014_1]|nr:MAG: Uncharacterized protein CEN87_455 [Parcubacteria group bacterium Licking1014_1]